MLDTNPNLILFSQDNPDAALLADLTARAQALTAGDTVGAEALLRSVARAGLSAIADEAVMQAVKVSTGTRLGALRTALRQMGGRDDTHSPPADTEAAPPPFPVYEALSPFCDEVMSLDALMGEGVAFMHSRVACPDEAAVVAVLWAIGTWGVRPASCPVTPRPPFRGQTPIHASASRAAGQDRARQPCCKQSPPSPPGPSHATGSPPPP